MADDNDDNIHGKLVVIGDESTGKTSLIKNLISLNSKTIDNTNKFNHLIEFNSNELNYKINKPVYIKSWEYPSNDTSFTEHERVLSLRSVLFCIITIDLRNPQTAYSAFNKWINIYEKYMKESFLFVVGTFLDYSIDRKVEVMELCKACSSKQAVYIEVSNNLLFDQTNMKLLRKLLSQRVDYMLKVRDTVINDLNEICNQDNNEFNEDKDDDDNNNNITNEEINKLKQDYTNYDSKKLHTPYLEPEIIYTSTGSILSSIMGIKEWPGLDNIPEDDVDIINDTEISNTLHNIKKFRNNVEEYLKKLEVNEEIDDELLNQLPDLPVTDNLFNMSDHSNPGNEDIDIDELKQLFDMIGFDPSIYPPVKPLVNPLPSQLPIQTLQETNQLMSTNINNGHISMNSTSSNSQSSNIPVSTNITPSIPKDNLYKRSIRSMNETTKTSPGLSVDSGVESQSNSSINTLLSTNNITINTTNYISKKKLKIRIQLPINSPKTNNENTADVRINIGDNILGIISQIGEKYKLTSEQRQKILLQLINSCT